MSEKPTEPTEQQISGNAMASTERAFVRMTQWQTVLSLVGVFIAVIALYAALKESAAVRQQTAASVWPFVQMLIEDYDTGDTAGFSMSFVNAGVGPAKLDAVRVEIGGQPMRNWAQAVAALGGDPAASNVSRNFLSGRVLRPDEKVAMLHTTDPDLARRFQAAIADPQNNVSYCYCSIFDECWLADSRRDLQNPESVAACPEFGDEAFDN